MVYVFFTQVDNCFATSDTGDDTGLVDVTIGAQSCGVSIQEVKVNEKQIRMEKNSLKADMSSVTVRVCVQSIMTAGDNSLLAYTDSNSVTATNKETFGSSLSVGDNDFSIAAAFLTTMGTTNFTCRMVSDIDGSKNKVGSLSIQYTVTLLDIIGVTKDDDDNIDDLMPLVLWRGLGSVPKDWTQIGKVTSTVTTGAYTLSYEDNVPSSVFRVMGQNTSGTESDITPEVVGV